MAWDIGRAVSLYDLGALREVRRVEGGFVNENWSIRTTRGRYFLKRRHLDIRNPSVIRAQHALIGHVRTSRFPAPAVLPGLDGDTLQVLDGEFFEIQEYVEGGPCDPTRPAQFRAAAATLGRYHAAVVGFASKALRGTDALSRPGGLERSLKQVREARELDGVPDLPGILERLENHAGDLARRFAAHEPLPRLVIHGDYYAGNLLFSEDRLVGVVDYDKACLQPRVVELAEALIYFAAEPRGSLRHLVYPGALEWGTFTRFLCHYAAGIGAVRALGEGTERPGPTAVLEGGELCVLADSIRLVWLSVSLQRLLGAQPLPADALEALRELVALCDWAVDNAGAMAQAAREAVNASAHLVDTEGGMRDARWTVSCGRAPHSCAARKRGRRPS